MILLEGQCGYDCFFVLATLKSIVVVFLDTTSGGTFALPQRMPTGFQECHHGAQYFSIQPPPPSLTPQPPPPPPPPLPPPPEAVTTT